MWFSYVRLPSRIRYLSMMHIRNKPLSGISYVRRPVRGGYLSMMHIRNKLFHVFSYVHRPLRGDYLSMMHIRNRLLPGFSYVRWLSLIRNHTLRQPLFPCERRVWTKERQTCVLLGISHRARTIIHGGEHKTRISLGETDFAVPTRAATVRICGRNLSFEAFSSTRQILTLMCKMKNDLSSPHNAPIPDEVST